MSQLVDHLRMFWTPGINEVRAGRLTRDMRQWISARQFQVYAPVGNMATLSIGGRTEVVEALACEQSRFASAALESAASVWRNPSLPKSKGWAAIQWYYAAFFAAHSLLRSYGCSLTQLEQGHVNDIGTVARLYGMQSSAQKGFHHLRLDAIRNEVGLTRLTGTGGTHEILWKTFAETLQAQSMALLSLPGSSAEIQESAAALSALRDVLSTPPSVHGAWLSYVRNTVNYRHEAGAWFPYQGHSSGDSVLTEDGLVGLTETVQNLIPPAAGAPSLVAFHGACRFTVALCIGAAFEMEGRCPVGRSFQSNGVLHLWRQLSTGGQSRVVR